MVSNHKSKNKFRLKPDIVATNEVNQEQVIFDTKWKLLDETKENKNYNISQADMYQLYAYGKKYDLKNGLPSEPKLVLLYPSNPNFQKPLDDFIYEGELVLSVLPFNLKNSLSKRDEQKELNKILGSISKTTMYYLQYKTLNMAAEDKIKYADN